MLPFLFAAVPLGLIVVDRRADLATVRDDINRLGKEISSLVSTPEVSDTETRPPPPSIQPLSADWSFLDCECNIYTA